MSGFRGGAAHWLCLSLLLMSCGRWREGRSARPIRSPERIEDRVPQLHGSVGEAPPVEPETPAPAVPEHPYMARHGASCMHVDPFTTNTYAWSGPVGRDPQVESRSMGFIGGECPTINFDSQGRIVTVCVQNRRPSLVLLDPDTLEVLARHALPKRRAPMLRMRKAVEDTSGGAYFYIDHLDRAVIGTADGNIDVFAAKLMGDEYDFVLELRIPLQEHLDLGGGKLDKVTSVMPDYQGNYWFAARYGTVGVVTADGQVRSVRLPDEEIQNSFSVSPDGVYVVTDHALYAFEALPESGPSIIWREPYDRGKRKKVGQVNQGSGTTPTLLGKDYVAIGDNAEPRMHVLVYKRGRDVTDERLVCKTPVFDAGASATENTLIGHGRSLIVENNAGYDIFRTMRRGRTSAPGIARIDLRPDDSGCDVVWESNEISQTTVPKMSAANGLIYLYTKLPNAPRRTDAYYFTALDFDSGETVFRVLTGTGVRFDNHWAAISLAPDGSAFIGVLNGLVRVRDSVPSSIAQR